MASFQQVKHIETTWAQAILYGSNMGKLTLVQYGQTHIGPIWVPFTAHIGLPILDPYWSHLDVPRWVQNESLLQNPHQSHMGYPFGAHVGSICFACWGICSVRLFFYINYFPSV